MKVNRTVFRIISVHMISKKNRRELKNENFIGMNNTIKEKNCSVGKEDQNNMKQLSGYKNAYLEPHTAEVLDITDKRLMCSY